MWCAEVAVLCSVRWHPRDCFFGTFAGRPKHNAVAVVVAAALGIAAFDGKVVCAAETKGEHNNISCVDSDGWPHTLSANNVPGGGRH